MELQLHLLIFRYSSRNIFFFRKRSREILCLNSELTLKFLWLLQDVSCSSEALHTLQGTVLYSSLTGEGLRLQYPSLLDLCSFFIIFLVTLYCYPKNRLNKQYQIC